MISYVLAPNPVMQFTDNSGNWVPYGTVLTLDWNTRQPKPTFYDPGGLSPRENPFRLDSIGRAFEVYWENDDAYFLALYDKFGQLIWSTAYPFVPSSGSGGNVTTFIGFTNLFINGQMRFFPVDEYSPIPVGTTLIAEGGWDFVKTGTNLTDTLEFVPYTPDNIAVDASPTYFLNYISLGAGTGETQKDLTFTFQDVRTLANEQVTVSLSLLTTLIGSYPVEIFATQFFGSASISVTPSASVVTPITTIIPTLTATQYTGTITIPNLIGKTIGTNGDDALIITFRMPLNSNANLQMTDFYFKRGGAAIQYPYESYAEVDATVKALNIPNPATTTDFPNPLLPSNFLNEEAYDVITLVPNDGLLIQQWSPPVPIGGFILWTSDIVPDGYLAATGQILIRLGQYNRLFNVPYSSGTFGTAFGTVANRIDSMVPFGGVNSQFWVNNVTPGMPIVAWSAGNTGFTLTLSSIGWDPQAVVVASLSAISFNVTNTTNGNTGTPVATNSPLILTIITPGSVSTPAVWDCTCVPASSIVGGTYLTWNTAHIALPDIYIYFIKDGVGADPLLPGLLGFPCNITSLMTIQEVTLIILDAVGQAQSAYINCLPASALVPGSYFVLATTTMSFQFYYQINGSITKPSLLVAPLVPIAILSSDTADIVATKTAAAFMPLLFQMPNPGPIDGIFTPIVKY